MRGQLSLEFLLVLTAFTVFLFVILNVSTTLFKSGREIICAKAAEAFLLELKSAYRTVSLLGEGNSVLVSQSFGSCKFENEALKTFDVFPEGLVFDYSVSGNVSFEVRNSFGIRVVRV